MTYDEALELYKTAEDTTGNLYKLLYGGIRRPYNLPIHKFIYAPADKRFYDAFIALYEQKNEDWIAAIEPYKDLELETLIVFKDNKKGKLLYCSMPDYTRTNGLHIKYGPTE